MSLPHKEFTSEWVVQEMEEDSAHCLVKILQYKLKGPEKTLKLYSETEKLHLYSVVPNRFAQLNF